MSNWCASCGARFKAPHNNWCEFCIQKARKAHEEAQRNRSTYACDNCKQPTRNGVLCMLCEDMLFAVAAQKGLVQAHRAYEALTAQIQRMKRGEDYANGEAL